jgi:hypothetical protein
MAGLVAAVTLPISISSGTSSVPEKPWWMSSPHRLSNYAVFAVLLKKENFEINVVMSV